MTRTKTDVRHAWMPFVVATLAVSALCLCWPYAPPAQGCSWSPDPSPDSTPSETNPIEATPNACPVGNPCGGCGPPNPAIYLTGEKTFTFTDVSLSWVGPTWSVTRRYSSKLQIRNQLGFMGYGWQADTNSAIYMGETPGTDPITVGFMATAKLT